MRILLYRKMTRTGATIGVLSFCGEPMGITLENPPRPEKILGETQIPAGEYRVEVRCYGGMHSRYAVRFPKWHNGMLWLRRVPNYEWIYFHIGNFVNDTDGCILVGSEKRSNDKSVWLTKSAEAYKHFYLSVIPYAIRKCLRIRIIDIPEETETAKITK